MNAAERYARHAVYNRSGGVCEVMVPGRCLYRATNYQHRKNRSQCAKDELWIAENGLHVCGSGTTGCHGWIHQFPRRSYELGWSVRHAHDPRRIPVFYRGYAAPQILESDGTFRDATVDELFELHAIGMAGWWS